MKITIRREQPDDVQAIFELTRIAFEPQPFSNGTEQFIINALRTAKALTLSLVAEVDARVVGHAAFSPVTISDGACNWCGLGPLSVLPELQRQGIGQALTHDGLFQIKQLGAAGCVVLGDPNYYVRFGFASDLRFVYEGVEPKYFMILPFAASEATGKVLFHPAFEATGDANVL